MNGYINRDHDRAEANHVSIKRRQPHSEPPDQNAKRRRTVLTKKHALQHVQKPPAEIEPAPQDEAVAQSQLLRAISIALSDAGFDGVKPTALEAFRASAEEYICHLLSDIKQSMHASRRSHPIPYDFTYAITKQGITLSTLIPHRDRTIPAPLLQPPIPPPPPSEPQPPSLETLLGPTLTWGDGNFLNRYIPAHFPPLPSRHTYRYTPIFTEREKDPRRIREQATQEGALAETALRKLMAASKTGRRKSSGSMLDDRHAVKTTRAEQAWEETLAALTRTRGSSSAEIDFGKDGAMDGRERPESGRWLDDEGVAVNYDRLHWMKGRTATSSTA